jgi:hypothetical protein
MTKTEICLRYLNGVVLPLNIGTKEINVNAALSVTAQMMALGYIPSQKLIDIMKRMKTSDITDLYDGVIPALRKFTGADVTWEPMYPNFPQQVIEASSVSLFLNAVGHYWTSGHWKPSSNKLPRKFDFEHSRFKEIGIVSEQEFSEIFKKLLGSSESISSVDKDTIKWFLDNEETLLYPDAIPFKENMCFLAGMFIENGVSIEPLLQTATDVLRVATHLSGGDISLGSNTKFKSLSKRVRRELLEILEVVVKEEDIERHRNKWKALFHGLHVGEFGWAEKVNDIAKKIRNNEPIRTFNGKVEMAIESKDFDTAIKLLKTRPGEFARRLDHLVRLSRDSKTEIAEAFINVSSKIPTRILLQLLGNFKTRSKSVTKKIVFPKGSMQKAVKVNTDIPPLGRNTLLKLTDGIEWELRSRFSKLPSLGKVWIDPLLAGCPIPTQMRSVSESAFTVARGTRLPIGHPDQNTLRLFIHWIGMDIDLSATLHAEDFTMIEQIAYYNQRSDKYKVYHSGDITYAPEPDGATEFIDITMERALASGARYLAMDVRVYNGPTFNKHAKCYAGWMTRQHPQSNELFDPKTVQAKVDVLSESMAATPVVFDLLNREAIWTDLAASHRTSYGGNNARSNKASITDILESITSIANKVTLHELFSMHAEMRGELVGTKEEADTVYSLYEGITPFNIMEINSSYIG